LPSAGPSARAAGWALGGYDVGRSVSGTGLVERVGQIDFLGQWAGAASSSSESWTSHSG
jgi:hypothetical protein